jgi:hypothetical protein
MPFIRGRFYANPIAGEALEAAREADESSRTSGSGTDVDRDDGSASQTTLAPARRIEIEVAELVPAHSGRTTTGYIARLHRSDPSDGTADSFAAKQEPEKRVFYDQGQLVDFLKNELAKNGSCR